MKKMGLILVGMLLSAGVALGQAAWNSGAVTGDYNTTGAGNFSWSDGTAWVDGIVPTNAAGATVSLETRMTGAATVTVDGTYTVGHLASRTSNNDGYFVGDGKIIFDNLGALSIWNHHSRTTRFTSLRRGIDIDFQLNNDLDIRFGTARANEAAVGRIGGTISGEGMLILSMAMNDSLTTRWHEIGTYGANTYAGGTLVRHVSRTGSYGTGHGVNARVMLDAMSTGAFGTGDVEIDGTDCNHSLVPYGTRGMVVRLSASDAIASGVDLTLRAPARIYLELAAETNQTIGNLYEIDLAGTTTQIQPGVYTGGDKEWLYGTGTLTVIPEPGTLGLALLGLVAFLIRRKFVKA